MHLWWISLLEWGFLALEHTSQGMKTSWIKPFSFKGHLEEKSYKKKEGNWGAARLCDSGIRDKRVTAGGGPGQSRGVTFHLGMVEDVRRTLGFSSDAETRGCSSLSPLSSPSSEAVLPESSCETELKKDWNESTSNASRKAEKKATLSDPLAVLLHPSVSRGTWKGGIPPLPVSPSFTASACSSFLLFHNWAGPTQPFSSSATRPWSTWSAIIAALKNSRFLYNKANQYKHCNRWWPLYSFRNFTSFFFLCFSLSLITWSIVPNKNQWGCITTNYC